MSRFLRQVWGLIGVLAIAFVASWVYFMPGTDARGVWRAQSGGIVLTLSPLRASLYSETSASCVHQLSFPAHMKLVEVIQGATIDTTDDALILSIDGALDTIPFERIAALPDTCTMPDPEASAEDVFDAMWTAMDEHYPFFDLHAVDWDARRALAPDTDLDAQATFALLSGALEGLDDGHIQLNTPVGVYSPSQGPSWLPEGLNRPVLIQIARDAIDRPLFSVDLTGIEYTLRPDGIGYVLIRHMSMDTPLGAKSGRAMQLAFGEVAEALAPARAIILDLRYNPGGSDSAAFGIASHFTGQPVDAFTKTTRGGDVQSRPFTATVVPFDATPLGQPVLVLTSGLTGSAAEILTLALREMPQVTVMGENTGGGLSDILSFTLPNGWDFGLSHQTYRAMDGRLFEGVGIPPDIPFLIDAAPYLAGEDSLLQAAIAQLTTTAATQ